MHVTDGEIMQFRASKAWKTRSIFLERIAQGCSRTVACKSIGIPMSYLKKWLYLASVKDDGVDDPAYPDFHDFAVKLDNAEVNYEVERLKAIQSSSDPKAHQWLLTMRFPTRYAGKEKTPKSRQKAELEKLHAETRLAEARKKALEDKMGGTEQESEDILRAIVRNRRAAEKELGDMPTPDEMN